MDNKMEKGPDPISDDLLDLKDEKLTERLRKIKEMEEDILRREKLLKEKEKAKKQILLRLSPSLWNDLAHWAENEYRSINGQIEYLLSECVRQRKK